MPEILVGVAIAGAVAFGGMQLMKSTQESKRQADLQLSAHTIQKLVEGELFSPRGCESLIGLQIGGALSINVGGQNIHSGSKYGGITVEELKYDSFSATDEKGSVGIAKISLVTNNGTNKSSRTEIPVPVNLGSNSAISGCDLFNGDAYQDIYENVCGGSFGSLSAGKSCPEVLTLIREMTIKKVCEDIYGIPQNVKLKDGRCDLNFVHANKRCPTDQYQKGFDQNGGIQCAPLTTPPTKPCASWSAWSPAQTSACVGINVNQARTCLDGGIPSSETRTVSGSQTGAACCQSWSEWAPNPNMVCKDKKLTQTRSCQSGSGTESRQVDGTKECGEKCWRVYCFVAGTQVTLASGKTQSIEKLAVGEMVQTYDEASGIMVQRPIKKVIHHKSIPSTLYTFTFQNGKTLTSNHEHRFYIVNFKGYGPAEQVYHEWSKNPDLYVLNEEGIPMLITDIKITYDVVNLYNIHVDGLYDSAYGESQYNHNYFANGVLVHNEKKEWDAGDLESKAITCCPKLSFKPTYPRGIYCGGDSEEKATWENCSSQSAGDVSLNMCTYGSF